MRFSNREIHRFYLRILTQKYNLYPFINSIKCTKWYLNWPSQYAYISLSSNVVHNKDYSFFLMQKIQFLFKFGCENITFILNIQYLKIGKKIRSDIIYHPQRKELFCLLLSCPTWILSLVYSDNFKDFSYAEIALILQIIFPSVGSLYGRQNPLAQHYYWSSSCYSSNSNETYYLDFTNHQLVLTTDNSR